MRILRPIPDPELSARNHRGHLVEMPARRWPRAPTAKFPSKQRPELRDPSPHRFIGDNRPALSEQILDVAKAEGETDVEPNGVLNDRGRELVAGERDRHSHVTRRIAVRYRFRDNARRGRDDRLPSAIIIAYCFSALCLARSFWARRIDRTVSGIEDNIETRCSTVHRRSPASAKAADHLKPKRAIVRDQAFASSL